MTDRKTGGPAPAPCPICSKPSEDQYRPFCSRRCADVDLHRWFSGQYSIPVKEDEDEDGGLPESSSPALSADREKH
jgi:endogenous inhibitor of DNA gyrase (YacG/DUF329 family)